MSRSGDCRLEFAGEERAFRLGLGEWRKIQELCDAGPAELLARLSPAFHAREQGLDFNQIVGAGLLGRWRVDDLREIILQGLMGAGMGGPDALGLVKDWVVSRPFFESVAVAYQIVLNAVIGAEDEAASGEPEAVVEGSPTSLAANSASEKTGSMPKAQRSASPHAKSTK